jgi:hypothetical protein
VSLLLSAALCDRRDLGSLYIGHFGGQPSVAQVLIYDLVPGGIGLTKGPTGSLPHAPARRAAPAASSRADATATTTVSAKPPRWSC